MYDFKYVCTRCGAVHYYLPTSETWPGGCGNCGHLEFEKNPVEKRKPKMSDQNHDDELDLSIDKLNLEGEWTRHSTQVYRWGQKQASAQLTFDQAKSGLDIVKGHLDREILEDPVGYGLPVKPSQGALDKCIAIQPEYKTAVNRLHSTRYDLQMVMAAVNALEHKKRALSMLVDLWTKDYYSDIESRPTSDVESEGRRSSVRSRGAERRAQEAKADDDF